MRFELVGYIIGILLLILGLMLLVPAAVDHADGHANARVFLYCGVLSYFFGGLLYLAFRGFIHSFGIRQAFILTTLSWLAISLFAAFPLYFSDIGISFTDAFFEAVSGFTTTGATVLAGLDSMSRGILIWRTIMEWVGGMGIVAFAILLLPLLRVGGMQLFQTESSDKSEKALPRTADMVKTLLVVYVALTVLCAIVYYLLGMTAFDAIAHAMTTLPTAGYSTHDASFGYFDSYGLHMAGTVFMLLGGLPFILYVKMLRNRTFDFHRDEQVRAFLVLYAAIVAVMTIWVWKHGDYDLADSFRHVAFNVASVITTCGFASTDYMQWGAFPVALFFFITYVGACAGSTAGGIKTMRLMIALAAVKKQVRALIHPHRVSDIMYQGKPVAQPVIQAVLSFLCLYVLVNIALSLALTFTGLDFVTAVTGAATAIANVGPGLGEIIGPAGNFKPLPDAAKWLLSAGMLLGRLEIVTVFVLFTPAFWKN